MIDIGIITSGSLPVPAVRGGAVESLIDNFIDFNEKSNDFKITIYSIYDDKVQQVNLKRKNTEYNFIKTNFMVKFIDLIIYFVAILLGKKKTMSYRHAYTRYYFLTKVGKKINKKNHQAIILENHFTEYIALKYKNNKEKYYKKVFYHSHNVPTFYKKYMSEIRCTNTIISVSNYMQNVNKSTFEKMDLNYRVLRNGVDQTIFHRINDSKTLEELKEKYHVSTKKRILLFAGRINKDKGIFEVLEAFKSLKEKYHLLLVGDYYFGSKIKNEDMTKVKKELLSFEGCYSFTGFVDYKNMGEVYNIADVVLLPSIWDDPAPLTVIEALNCGKTLITTNSGGIPEYARNESAIILNKESDLPLQIVNAINSLDEETTSKLHQNALIVSQDLSLERYYIDFSNIIKESLNHGKDK